MKKLRYLAIALLLALSLTPFISGFQGRTVNAYSLENGEKVYSIITDRIMYETQSPYYETINTFEAWIQLPSDLADSVTGGVIMGSYYNAQRKFPGTVNFGVGTNGNFHLFWNNGAFTHTFTSVDLRNDEWTHVAIVRDASANKILYYVNGEVKEEVEVVLGECVSDLRFGIGTDWNNWYNEKTPFYGKIEQVTVYSSAQPQEIIREDMTKRVITSNEREGLMSNWYFGKKWSFDNEMVEDTSSAANHCTVGTYDKYVEVEEFEDYDYSLLVVPDMQIMNAYKKENFVQQSQWIVNSAKELNTQFVMYLGDMTEHKYVKEPELSTSEWETARSCISMLDGKVRYSFVLGNHDYNDWGATRDTSMFNKYFPYEKYSKNDYFGGAFQEGYMDNYYSIFSVGDVKYMILSLEYLPRINVVNWADRMISEHPDCRVIVTTHYFMDCHGKLDSGTYNPYSYTDSYRAQQMWEKVLSKHSNVFMAFSGHIPADYLFRRQDKGINGNTFTSVLVDLQGAMMSSAMNTLLVIKVNERNKTMNFCYYSPEYDACYNLQNQFTMSFADEFNPTIGGVEEQENNVVQELATNAEDSENASSLQGVAAMSFTGLTAMCAIVKAKRKEEQI